MNFDMTKANHLPIDTLSHPVSNSSPVNESQSGTSPTTHMHQPNEYGIDPVVFDGLQRLEHRMFVLRVSLDLESLLNNPRQKFVEYTNMNSYERLIVHRVADHFQMNHVPDKARMGVTVYKTEQSDMPRVNLKDIPGPLNVEKSEDGQAPSFKIIQRGPRKNEGSQQFVPRKYVYENGGSFNGNGQSHIMQPSQQSHTHKGPKPFKSYEEKEAAYQQARARIFQEPEGDVVETSNGDSVHDGFQSNKQVNSTTNTTHSNPRPKNFVPRVQSSQPRPRYSNISMTFNGPAGNNGNSSTGANSMDGYAPYMFNPALVPYMYRQTGDAVNNAQIGGIPANGIYVDPYTGAQYLVAMPPEYFQTENVAASNESTTDGPLQTEPTSEQSDAVEDDSLQSPAVTMKLPLQFGSLKISGESSNAVTFKPMK